MKLKKILVAKKNTKCRYCKSTHLIKFLSLGNHPPSDSFIRPNEIHSEIRYPLEVYFCKECFLVQLVDVVPAEILFGEFLYLSSSSKALKNHYTNLAHILTNKFYLKSGDVVVDIGCNDGILLHGYAPGLIKIGVEPSSVAEVAMASGLEVVKAFFGEEAASEIVKKHKKAKVVTATNVFAHVDNIANFVKGLPILLDADGVFIIEAPYLIDLIDKTLFDTIYHEHLCYLSLTPLISFLSRFGLEIFDVERVPFGASGTAVRFFVKTKKSKRLIEKTVENMLIHEKQWGIGDIKKYLGYAKKVEKVKKDVLKLIRTIKKSGAHLGGYGAPAKGSTLLNYFELSTETIEYIAETNPIKQGLLTPGSHIPIICEEEFLKRMPEYALLLSWNYLDFFLEKSEYIKRGGKFLVPLPKPIIVP